MKKDAYLGEVVENFSLCTLLVDQDTSVQLHVSQFFNNFKNDEAGAVEDEKFLWASRMKLGIFSNCNCLLILGQLLFKQQLVKNHQKD